MRVHGNVPPEHVAAAIAFSAGHTITETLVRDVLEGGWQIDEVVEMDEFTLDLLIEADGVWVVYDTT